MQTRDGQIFTNYPHVNSDPPAQQRIKSDLQNWVYWCFSVGVPNAGMAHFQNHSLNQVSYRRIGTALNEATTTPIAFEAVEPADTAEVEKSAAGAAAAADEASEFAPVA